MTDLNIDYLLVEWGKWSRGGIGGQAASNVWAGSRRGFAPDISDDVALRVDAAVVACGVSAPRLRDILQLHYQKGITLLEIQLQMRIGRRSFEREFAEAKGFVSGYLSGERQAA